MSTIDKRIVEMEFENRNFENGIKDSEKSLKDFDKALREAGSGGSSLSSLGDIAGGVGGKFSALGLVAAGALMSIGAMAVDVGMQITKALTLDQVIDGFIEYELKMNAIKVMMASGITKEGLPVTLEQVNKHLEDLNVYADRTIYSFKDMTRTIGQFTNAGVNIELAVTSIMGISNAAALAGASTEEAGRAMDAFAKALAFGHVSLRQWRSIELSKLGTVEFKQQLLDAGVAAGTLEKQADGMYKVLTAGATKSKMGNVISATHEFSYSLHNQWLTTEVLTDTLERYGDVTTDIGKKADEAATTIRTFTMLKANVTEAIASGWGVTFERIIGDFDESSALFTGIANTLEGIILKANDARNDLLQEWKDLGGRDDILLGFRRGWATLTLILRQAKKAFEEVFPPVTAATLKKLSESFLGFISSFSISGKNVSKFGTIFRNVFKGIETLGKNIWNILKAISDGFRSVFSGPTLDQIVAIARGFHSFMRDITLSDKSIGYLKTIFEGLFSVISLVGQFIFSVFRGLYNGIRSVIDLIPPGKNGGILGFLANIATWLINLKDAAKNGEVFTKISEAISNAIFWLGGAIGTFITKVKESETLQNIFTTIGEVFGWFATKIGELVTALKESEFIGLILQKIKDTFGQFSTIDTSKLDGIGEKLKEFFGGLKEKLAPAWDKIIEAFEKIKAFISEKWNTEGFNGIIDTVNKLLKSGVLVAIMKFLGSKTGVTPAAQGFKGLFDILGGFKDTLEAYQKSLNAKNLLTIAAAIGILVASLLVITLMDQGKLTTGVLIIAAFFLELAGGMAALNRFGGGKGAAKQMFLMAASILVLALGLRMLAKVEPSALWAMTVIIAELIAANLLLSKGGADSSKGTANLLGMAAAMVVIAIAVKMLSKMDPKEMWQGIYAVGALMGAMLIFSVVMGNFGGGGGKLLAASIAMGIMAIALLELVGVVAILAQFDPEKLTTGLLGLAGIMLIMVAGMSAIANPNVLLGAAAMIIMAAAITLFVPAIKLLGALPLETIGIGLLSIAAIFAVLGIAGAVLAPIVPAILGLAVSVALLGVAVLAAGTGVMMFGAGLVLIAAAGFGAVSVLIYAIKQITALLPYILTKIGEAIVAFAGVIKNGAPAIMEAFGAIITSLLDLVVTLVPKILETVSTLVTALLNFIVEKVPEILTAVFTIIRSILDLLLENIPEFVDTGMKIILGFLKGINNNIQAVVEAAYDIVINLLNGIAKKIPELITAGADIVIAWVEGITTEVPRVVDTAFQLVIDFINGLADSIRTNTPLILEAAANLATAFVDGVKEYLNLEEGETIAGHIIQGLIDGINKGVVFVVQAAKDLGGAVVSAIKALLGIESPSKVTEEMGKFIDLGLAKGIQKGMRNVIDASEQVGDKALNALQESMKRISDVFDSDVNTNPTITPVLDLNNFKSGVNTLDSMLASSKSYGLAALKVSHDKDIARSNQNGSNLLKEQLTTIHNEFNLNGITIRSEADIEKLAQELFTRQENALRSRGIRPSYVY